MESVEMKFYNLESVKDYWQKVEYDFSQLRSRPNDPYIAFNFFLTIHHLEDWFCHEIKEVSKTDIRENDISKICSHIANGLKHMVLTSKRHKSVEEVAGIPYYDPDYVEEGYSEKELVIILRNGKSIKVIDLAECALNRWSKLLAEHKVIDSVTVYKR